MTIAQIRAELEAATPGPWAISYLHEGFGDQATRTPQGICSVGEQKRMIVLDVLEAPVGQPSRKLADIELIANLPEYLAALLDVVAAAQAFRDLLRPLENPTNALSYQTAAKVVDVALEKLS